MIQGKTLLSVRVSKVILILRDIDAMVGQVEQRGVMALRNWGVDRIDWEDGYDAIMLETGAKELPPICTPD